MKIRQKIIDKILGKLGLEELGMSIRKKKVDKMLLEEEKKKEKIKNIKEVRIIKKIPWQNHESWVVRNREQTEVKK